MPPPVCDDGVAKKKKEKFYNVLFIIIMFYIHWCIIYSSFIYYACRIHARHYTMGDKNDGAASIYIIYYVLFAMYAWFPVWSIYMYDLLFTNYYACRIHASHYTMGDKYDRAAKEVAEKLAEHQKRHGMWLYHGVGFVFLLLVLNLDLNLVA